MKARLKQIVVIATVGTFGLGAGIIISAGTGLFGAGAHAEESEVDPNESKAILEDPPVEVLNAFEEADLTLGKVQTNASGQTFGNDLGTEFPDDVPDLIAAWVDPNTIGYILKEDMFPEVFGKSGLVTTEVAERTFTAYESDGITVITKELKLSE